MLMLMHTMGMCMRDTCARTCVGSTLLGTRAKCCCCFSCCRSAVSQTMVVVEHVLLVGLVGMMIMMMMMMVVEEVVVHVNGEHSLVLMDTAVYSTSF